MNLNSNRPTAVSRLIWDSDLEPKNNYALKGDLVGRLARNCFLTTDSSSGVLAGTFPKCYVEVGSRSVTSNVSGYLTETAEFSLDSFCNSIRTPSESSDGSIVYYPSGIDGGVLIVPCFVKGYSKCKFTQSFTFTANVEYLDSSGVVLDTEVLSSSVSYSGIADCSNEISETVFSGTLNIPVLECSKIRVSFDSYYYRGIASGTGYRYYLVTGFLIGPQDVYYDGAI